MGENVCYVLHKYNIVNSDWSQNINILYNEVELHINGLININHKFKGLLIFNKPSSDL